MAKTTCALSIVRQLFHLGILPSADQPIRTTKKMNAYDVQSKFMQIPRKRYKLSIFIFIKFLDNSSKTRCCINKRCRIQLPEIECSVDAQTVNQIDEYLRSVGLKPIDDAFDKTTQKRPRSLLISQRLDEYVINDVLTKSSKTFRFPTAKQTQPIESIEWAPPLKNWNCWQGCHINSRTNAYKTLEKISEELMAKEMQKQHSPGLIRSRQDLPSFMYRHQVIETVEKNSVVVIKGTTGCGKSTQASKRSCLFLNCKNFKI